MEEGSLVTEIAFTKVAGSERETATFISTGEKAFVDAGGKVLEVPAIPFSRDVGAVESGLGELPIGHWFQAPTLSDGGVMGGTNTYHITARLNAGAALSDIFTLARLLGSESVAGLPPMSTSDIEHLQRSVRSADLDIYTGKDDLLLRRMDMAITFGASGLPQLQTALKQLAGVRFTFHLSIDDLNQPIEVQDPADP